MIKQQIDNDDIENYDFYNYKNDIEMNLLHKHTDKTKNDDFTISCYNDNNINDKIKTTDELKTKCNVIEQQYNQSILHDKNKFDIDYDNCLIFYDDIKTLQQIITDLNMIQTIIFEYDDINDAINLFIDELQNIINNQ